MLRKYLINFLLGYPLFRKFVVSVVVAIRIDEVREGIKDEIVDFSQETVLKFAESRGFPKEETLDYLRRYKSVTKRYVNQRFNGALEGLEVIGINGRTGQILQ